MPAFNKLVRIPTLKTVAEFRRHLELSGIELPCEDQVAVGLASPLVQPLARVQINRKRLGNRWAVQPMEGWDGTTSGAITDEVRRRWKRFGESGAKLICGGEAMAVRPDGRANPNQLLIMESTKKGLAELRDVVVRAHSEHFGVTEDLVIGFQLTHSGRFCRPVSKSQPEPRVAFRHPLLDARFQVTSDEQVLTDSELERLRDDYVAAAKIARDVGADFVDIKHCHGYLLHELLGAHTRPGRYGGPLENRMRFLAEVIAAIRASGNPIEIGVRLSAFDWVPFKPDPSLSTPGKPGPGVPEDYTQCLPYRFGFGVDQHRPVGWDLTETFEFARRCVELGVKILNLSAGSPYYNPHIQRPAAYPPSDGYAPPEDPLSGVARQIESVRQVREYLHRQVPGGDGLVVVGSAYSYLQEYLPHVAQYVVRHEWTDLVGVGRMVLSYPRLLADATESGVINSKLICRTFSDCTSAPRNGMVSGCYPLDKYYASRPEAQQLKLLRKPGAE
jgi:NADPH2 dehydrogenase